MLLIKIKLSVKDKNLAIRKMHMWLGEKWYKSKLIIDDYLEVSEC
jgi:hypothetical protein